MPIIIKNKEKTRKNVIEKLRVNITMKNYENKIKKITKKVLQFVNKYCII